MLPGCQTRTVGLSPVLNSLGLQINEAVGECQLHKVTRGLMSFILDDLSRWYIQLVRPRLWLEEESEEKQYAYENDARM